MSIHLREGNQFDLGLLHCIWNLTGLKINRQNEKQNWSCPSSVVSTASNYKGDPVPVPRYSKYFLQCPVSSRHAQYSWQHDENSTACSSGKEQCLYLIDNMDSECKGTYKCISQEMGYSKVLVQYELQVENDAKTQQYKQLWPNKAEGRKTSPVIWVCLMMALIKSLSF